MTTRICGWVCKLRLTANHYDVVFAADGVASIAEARKHMPDLMILDLGLPAGDGFSVLERMKVNERLSAIPVIVLSGRDRVGNWDRAMRAGAKTFLQSRCRTTSSWRSFD